MLRIPPIGGPTPWTRRSLPHGNILSYMVYPYYLPAERITMVVMLNSAVDIPGSWMMVQDITRIVSPNHPWPNLPKQ